MSGGGYEVLHPCANPRPAGYGWELVEYDWSEKYGTGRLVYERAETKERSVIDIAQPAGPHHEDAWPYRREPAHEDMLASYFQNLAHHLALRERGEYLPYPPPAPRGGQLGDRVRVR